MAQDSIDRPISIGADQAIVGDQAHQVRTRANVLFMLLAVILLVAVARGWSNARAEVEMKGIQSSVNPNTAPWHELTILPGIGENRARTIVKFRESEMAARSGWRQPVFSAAIDLDRVPGLGAKTVADIAGELCFD